MAGISDGRPGGRLRSIVRRVCRGCELEFFAARIDAVWCSDRCRLHAQTHPRCGRCGQRKAASEFKHDAKGHPLRCKPCALTDTQEWRARHRDELLARRRAAYAETRQREGDTK
jgi:hypothetical protein